MMRYLPPNGTAGLLRTSVSGRRRSPFPPAMMIPKTRFGFKWFPSVSFEVLRVTANDTNLQGDHLTRRCPCFEWFCCSTSGWLTGEFPSTLHRVYQRRCNGLMGFPECVHAERQVGRVGHMFIWPRSGWLV